jgi:O-antigen ligase
VKNFAARIPDANSWLLAALFFLIPIQVAPAYVLSAIMLLLWVAEGRFDDKWRLLRAEPLAWLCAAYYGVFLLSLLWTTDLSWGWRMVQRQNVFLLFLLYFTVARREHFGRYLAAFLLSIAVCEVFAYYNWARMEFWPQLPPGIRVEKDPLDTAPFVDRIMYTPALALAGYLSAHQALFGKIGKWQRIACLMLALTTVGNLLFSGGRAGLVGFLALLALLAFQYFPRRRAVAFGTACMLVLTITAGGYLSNDYFRVRANDAVSDVQHYESNPNTSVGLRITYLTHAWRIFMAHPLLGVGAGDYPAEYQKMNDAYTPTLAPAWNPHNQYMLALTSAGIPGGALLALVLAVPLLRRSPDDGRERMRRAVPVLFMTICMFESYLMRSNTGMMYVLFTAALWRGTREEKI